MLFENYVGHSLPRGNWFENDLPWDQVSHRLWSQDLGGGATSKSGFTEAVTALTLSLWGLLDRDMILELDTFDK